MHFKRVATGHSPFTAKHTQGSVNSSPSDTHIFLWPSNTSGWQVHTEYLKNDTSTCTKEKSQVIKVTGVLTCHMKWSSDYDRGILWSALLINYLSRNCPKNVSFNCFSAFVFLWVKRLSASVTPVILYKHSVQHSLSSDADTCSWGSASKTAKPFRSEGGWEIHCASQQARIWKEYLAFWSVLLADSLRWIAKSP